jgi:DHA2 family methylenomycin A resistance protein-like MFS transporter
MGRLSERRASMSEISRRRLTLLAMCISQAMILLDITIVNIALPSIQRELSMSPSRLEWVVSAYALSLAALIPFGGTLGDRYGRKRLFLIGMVVFTVGSIGCALSPAATALIGARVIQGIGGAIMSALTLSILTETFPPETRAGAIGTWAAIAGLGFGAGPVVGGILLGFFGWSSIFWVNVPLALVGLVLTVVAVKESRDPVPRPLDVPGVITSALGLLAVTFGLIESSSYHWGSWLVAAPLVVGVALLVVFALWEHHTPSPMLPPGLLRARSFTVGCSVYLLVYLALTGVMFYVTLLYQNVEGWSALRTGLSWLSMNIPFLVMAQLSGRLHRRFSSTAVVTCGCLVGACGTLGLSLVMPSTPFALAGVGYALLGAGYGTLVPGITNVAMRDVPAGVSGCASGILNSARQVGTSVGLAVLGAIGVNAAVSDWTSRTAGFPASTRAAAAGQAQHVAGAQIGAVTKALGAAYRAPAVESFAHGYRLAMIVAAGAVFAAAACTLFGLGRAPAPSGGDDSALSTAAPPVPTIAPAPG